MVSLGKRFRASPAPPSLSDSSGIDHGIPLNSSHNTRALYASNDDGCHVPANEKWGIVGWTIGGVLLMELVGVGLGLLILRRRRKKGKRTEKIAPSVASGMWLSTDTAGNRPSKEMSAGRLSEAHMRSRSELGNYAGSGSLLESPGVLEAQYTSSPSSMTTLTDHKPLPIELQNRERPPPLMSKAQALESQEHIPYDTYIPSSSSTLGLAMEMGSVAANAKGVPSFYNPAVTKAVANQTAYDPPLRSAPARQTGFFPWREPTSPTRSSHSGSFFDRVGSALNRSISMVNNTRARPDSGSSYSAVTTNGNARRGGSQRVRPLPVPLDSRPGARESLPGYQKRVESPERSPTPGPSRIPYR
ncbi:hypothetical protein T439DRAFT_360729 [Meredithblackwellia eburnea MCA 4105]